MTKKLHILTINVQGLCEKQKRDRFYSWIKQQKGNIILAQETHYTNSITSSVKSEWQGDIFHSFGTTQSCGVTTYISRNINYEIIDTHNDKDGRILLINIKINDNIYTIVNIYAPNDRKRREKYYKDLKNFIETYALGLIIIGGDWNEIQNPIDRLSKGKPKKAVNSLKLLIKEGRLVDIWRKKFPNLKQFTWKRKNVKNEASRIDYFLTQKEIIHKIISTDIRPVLIKYTDHQAVSMVIDVENVVRGPGYWKVNNSLMNDVQYELMMIKILNKYNNMTSNDKITKQIIWDLCKIEIRERSIEFGKQKARLRKNLTTKLENDLKKLSENNGNEEEIKSLEKQIEEQYVYKSLGYQIRSRANWIEKGEKNTKYFLSLEKGRQLQKTITRLYNDKGEIIKNQDDLLLRQKQFYEEIYATKNPTMENINQYLESVQLESIISNEDSSKCEGLITENECFKAVKNMKSNKSPGSDGLTVEFYKKFWKYIKELLLNSINEGYNRGKLSDSQRVGILSLMYKKNDPCDLNNWRPLTLLNTDYKIIARCLAERIKPILPKIINTDQNGFIQGRNIGYNIRLIQDIIDYAEKFEINGTVIFLDFAKAFDSIEWEFMLCTLKKFGFKEGFIKWISTLYSDISSLINNNGWLSEPVKISRGIRQGCPISALLFVITVEILALKIRQSKDIRGLKIKQSQRKEFKISQLADDTTLFLKSKNDITAALNLIEIFGTLSGLILNRHKSQGLRLGNNKICIDDHYEDIDWTSDEMKALGIYFGLNAENISKKNWECKIEKIIRLVKAWKKRKMTLIGRIQIAKSLLIPQITYLISVIPIAKKVISEVEKIIFDFIWDGKSEKVKRKTLCRKYCKGGLNALDLRAHILTILAGWVKKLKNDTNSQWKIIPEHYLNYFGNNLLIFSMNIMNTKNVEGFSNLPLFYQEIVKAWVDIGGGQTEYPKSLTEIGKQKIWGNHRIMHRNKVLIFKNWIKSNIITIRDLLNQQGKISENIILNKLDEQSNWISQLAIVKKSIPK